MKIVLTGGGTGGHLIPLIAVKRKIEEKNPDAQFLFLGPGGELEKKIMGEEGVPMKKVSSGKMRRYFSFLNFLDAFKIPLGILQSLWILLFNMPDAIFSKGGYSSIPVVLAGWAYRIPIMIHESDANPGLANSMSAKFANRVALSYPEAQVNFTSEQAVLTGSPLREDINKGNAQKAKDLFRIENDKKIIFVWGGSQGARKINNAIVEILPELLARYNVIHQTGDKNIEEVKHKAGVVGVKAGRDGYYPMPFFGEELKDVLALADIVISRAGSSSIAEIAANGKPSILIPLEISANDHQRMNAYAVARAGGAEVLEENNLGGSMLLGMITKIISEDDLRSKLATNIQKFYHKDAAERIAEGVVGMIG